MPENLRQQMRSNAVALISLAVALSSLSYNTWRNERTEANRNVRLAAFEVLKNLGELQVTVNFAYFAKNEQLGNPMAGWGRVALISDLSSCCPRRRPSARKSSSTCGKPTGSRCGTINRASSASRRRSISRAMRSGRSCGG